MLMANLLQGFLSWINGVKPPVTDAEKFLSSPDGTIKLKITLRQGHISYSVTKGDITLIRESKLGMKIKDHPVITDHLAIVRTTEKSIEETWETVWGEEHFIVNSCNEMALYLSETSKLKRLFTLRFRVFNDGIAFRYELPPQPAFSRIEIEDELTEFNIDLNANSWSIPAYQPDRY